MQETELQLHHSSVEAGTIGRDHAADLTGTLYETVLLAILEGLRSAPYLHIAQAACTDTSISASVQKLTLFVSDPSRYRHSEKQVLRTVSEKKCALESSRLLAPR